MISIITSALAIFNHKNASLGKTSSAERSLGACYGDTLPEHHVSANHQVLLAADEYLQPPYNLKVGETFTLNDFNGDLNGGHHTILVIDSASSWCGPCQTQAPKLAAVEEWAEKNKLPITFITSFYEPGQPYSPQGWRDAFGGGVYPKIFVDEGWSICNNPDVKQECEDFDGCDGIDLFCTVLAHGDSQPVLSVYDHHMRHMHRSYHFDYNTHYDSECDVGYALKHFGTNKVTLQDVLLALVEDCYAEGLCKNNPQPCVIVKGDANSDGAVNVQDIVLIVNNILGITELQGCSYSNGDTNGDNSINVQDIVNVVNIIIGN